MEGRVPVHRGGWALTHRLLLDAHLSPKRLGRLLERRGHDVLALAATPNLEGMSDPQVLELATEDRRILVTRDGKDLRPIVRSWAMAGRVHAGVLLLWSLDLHDYSGVARAIHEQVTTYSPEEWQGLTVGI